ncbi:hypothetical protein [Thalassoglobus sp.]|uniref:tetratricopeptide repeat protein n=1 Tax=Thalassoglobus sp. TaxID=2795869 RepID=UPI003AA98491
MKCRNIYRVVFALLIGAIASPVIAETSVEVTASKRINFANELVREGKYDEAIASYQEIQPTAEIQDELNYNVAVAQYRKGDLEAAKALFTAASASPQSSLASAARYNLGNCFYAQAVASAEQDKPAAIEALLQAIENYRGALTGNSNLTEARANIELAVELLKKLEQEQEEEKQQQQEQQQNQDQQQENQEQQNQEQQENQKNQKKEQNSDSEQEQQDQDAGQEKKDQEQPGKESKDEQSQKDQDSQQQEEQADSEQKSKQESKEKSDQNKEGQPDESQNETGKQENQRQSDQQPSTNQQQKPQQQSAEEQAMDEQAAEEPGNEEEQAVPTGELKAAGEQDSKEKPNGQNGIADPNMKEGLMSKEEALKMLQAVRDRDMLRRLRKEQVERRQRIPTARDW